ncbi:MAG TPA: hypothetical protein VJK51_03295 [Candidatus Nanoarchaeia archaeon]|nr:hypothetical protein [Candidatus Nanoarchaeia archaeon]
MSLSVSIPVKSRLKNMLAGAALSASLYTGGGYLINQVNEYYSPEQVAARKETSELERKAKSILPGDGKKGGIQNYIPGGEEIVVHHFKNDKDDKLNIWLNGEGFSSKQKEYASLGSIKTDYKWHLREDEELEEKDWNELESTFRKYINLVYEENKRKIDSLKEK